MVQSTVWYSTVQYSMVQCSTVQCSTVQCSTVQYSTVQYSTVHDPLHPQLLLQLLVPARPGHLRALHAALQLLVSPGTNNARLYRRPNIYPIILIPDGMGRTKNISINKLLYSESVY